MSDLADMNVFGMPTFSFQSTSSTTNCSVPIELISAWSALIETISKDEDVDTFSVKYDSAPKIMGPSAEAALPICLVTPAVRHLLREAVDAQAREELASTNEGKKEDIDVADDKQDILEASKIQRKPGTPRRGPPALTNIRRAEVTCAKLDAEAEIRSVAEEAVRSAYGPTSGTPAAVETLGWAFRALFPHLEVPKTSSVQAFEGEKLGNWFFLPHIKLVGMPQDVEMKAATLVERQDDTPPFMFGSEENNGGYAFSAPKSKKPAGGVLGRDLSGAKKKKKQAVEMNSEKIEGVFVEIEKRVETEVEVSVKSQLDIEIDKLIEEVEKLGAQETTSPEEKEETPEQDTEGFEQPEDPVSILPEETEEGKPGWISIKIRSILEYLSRPKTFADL